MEEQNQIPEETTETPETPTIYKYAQINLDTGVCVGVSYLSGEVIADHMIPLEIEDDVKPGDIWDGETWTRPDPPPAPEPGPSRIDMLEEENAFLALELAQTQARLDQTEQEQAELLLLLVGNGVI